MTDLIIRCLNCEIAGDDWHRPIQTTRQMQPGDSCNLVEVVSRGDLSPILTHHNTVREGSQGHFKFEIVPNPEVEFSRDNPDVIPAIVSVATRSQTVLGIDPRAYEDARKNILEQLSRR